MQEQIQNPNALFTGPVPGSSLTTETGNRPWENPPKEFSLDAVINNYIRRLQAPDIVRPIMDAIRYGTSITTIVESVIETAVMEGEHSLDIGILASPVIVEYLKQLAEAGKIDYKLTDGDVRAETVKEKIDGRLLEKVLNDLENDKPMEKEIKKDKIEEEPKGLMSKRGNK